MRSPRRRVVLLAALALALAAAGCGGGDDGDDGPERRATPTGGETTLPSPTEVPADAIALVDGEKVPKAQYKQLVEQARAGYKQQKRPFPKPGTPEFESLKGRAVTFLVERVEFAQEAKRMGITVTDAEVDKRIEDYKEQYFGGDDKKFAENIETQGASLEQVRDDVRAQVISEKLYNALIKDVKVTDEEIRAYYEENEEQFQQPATRDVRHILIACEQPAECAKKKPQAEDVYRQLTNGGDFAALARELSADEGSAKEGGKLTIRQGQTVAPFDEFSFSAKTGEISRPIKTQFGWHVIETLADVKPAATTPFEDVKESIRQQLAQQNQSKTVDEFTRELRESYQSRVVYAVGFEPPAVEEEEEPATTATATDETGTAATGE